MILLDDLKFYEDFFKTPRTREELRKYWKCDNRTVRDYISKLQKDLNIVNLQDGKGWYIPDNSADVSAYAKQEYSRGIKSIAKAYRMNKRCGIDFQMDLDEIFNDIRKGIAL